VFGLSLIFIGCYPNGSIVYIKDRHVFSGEIGTSV
jgi:hypothetical protein